MSSHLLAEVDQTADRVVIVGAGKLVSRFADLLGGDGVAVQVTGPETLTVSGLTAAEVGRRPFTDGDRVARAATAHQRPGKGLLPAHRRSGAVRGRLR
ncbi:hypothetical protein [Modestobacter sp. DSM 44400]|uniref:hypothetical protein n=1 Tax=Modestobacter sp. DSM 44400 TaxID=1550230 RepID=UPI0020C90AEA|nr:hypothetical protein [Modestobacter sp. DSM 44400]